MVGGVEGEGHGLGDGKQHVDVGRVSGDGLRWFGVLYGDIDY